MFRNLPCNGCRLEPLAAGPLDERRHTAQAGCGSQFAYRFTLAGFAQTCAGDFDVFCFGLKPKKTESHLGCRHALRAGAGEGGQQDLAGRRREREHPFQEAERFLGRMLAAAKFTAVFVVGDIPDRGICLPGSLKESSGQAIPFATS